MRRATAPETGWSGFAAPGRTFTAFRNALEDAAQAIGPLSGVFTSPAVAAMLGASVEARLERDDFERRVSGTISVNPDPALREFTLYNGVTIQVQPGGERDLYDRVAEAARSSAISTSEALQRTTPRGHTWYERPPPRSARLNADEQEVMRGIVAQLVADQGAAQEDAETWVRIVIDTTGYRVAPDSAEAILQLAGSPTYIYEARQHAPRYDPRPLTAEEEHARQRREPYRPGPACPDCGRPLTSGATNGVRNCWGCGYSECG